MLIYHIKAPTDACSYIIGSETMGWLFGSDSGKKKLPDLQQGWFESKKAFNERVLRAGEKAHPEQFRNAKRTLAQMDADAKRSRDRARAKQQRQINAQNRRAARVAKQKRTPNNNPDSWW